ncbi:hypothetical protein DGMP_16620 [Desulfomarina profundi]|uniref:Uncharacterized protein n=1 Tax=Desulfomarina profundi TaxID=2772557 RepID=A0A8D5FSL9_9BACT|nr:hypothetical protein [Desulfomarina profundi]BCL60969.1 hypothetical protein DGMP_16620 [Desulfomarina profundi]
MELVIEGVEMSEEKIKFLSFDEAVRLVAAIQEEEDIEQENRRILTVYNHDDRELCWFDYEEVVHAVGDVSKGDLKEAVQNYILSHIPDWALEI